MKCPCLYFVVSKNVSKLPKGITHPCSNVRPANLVQRSHQTVENRVRQSLKHVFGHAGNLGNSCADNAVALGELGYVSWHHLEEKDGLFHVPTRMQSWTFLLPSVKLKILFNVGENVVCFFLIARNSMCASPLPDFLMEFRRDDSEDAFDIKNTLNIALLLVTVIDFDAGRLAHSCHFAQNHVPNSNGARWRTTRLLTIHALQCLSFCFLVFCRSRI